MKFIYYGVLNMAMACGLYVALHVRQYDAAGALVLFVILIESDRHYMKYPPRD